MWLPHGSHMEGCLALPPSCRVASDSVTNWRQRLPPLTRTPSVVGWFPLQLTLSQVFLLSVLSLSLELLFFGIYSASPAPRPASHSEPVCSLFKTRTVQSVCFFSSTRSCFFSSPRYNVFLITLLLEGDLNPPRNGK